MSLVEFNETLALAHQPDGALRAVPDVLVSVFHPGTTITANIYESSVGIVKNNPLLSDSQGRINFWAAEGEYTVKYEDTEVPSRIATQQRSIVLVDSRVSTDDIDAGAITLSKLDSGVAQALVPPGSIIATARSTAPAGWLMADGAAVSRATYVSLFDAIGTTYGAGDGSTTFNVPDLRGRVPVGVDGAAARLDALDALGQSGGVQKYSLQSANIPAHGHSFSDRQFPFVSNANGASWQRIRVNDAAGAYSVAAQYAGVLGDGIFGSTGFTNTPGVRGDGAVAAVDPISHMQPYQVVNYLVKT